jgi:DNA-3-methyladenine glycosylase
MFSKSSKRPLSFFSKDAKYIAKNILGDYLVVKKGKTTLVGKIIETESYLGIKDDASHSFKGKVTNRNKILYDKGGAIYVYLIYGKSHCFNIVVSKRGNPQAVFIRALEPVEGISYMKTRRGVKKEKELTNGPCKWTQSFGVDKSFLGKSICSKDIFIAKNSCKDFKIIAKKRIGVEYATKCKDLKLRFYIKNNPFISKK